MAFATRGDRRIAWQSNGAGDPVLLLPGLGSGARLFGTLPRRLERSGLRALTFDPVGVPPSSPHTGEFAFKAAARDALAVLDDAGIERCALAGTSLGGKVALQMCALASDRISRLVLLAASAVVTARAHRVYRFFEAVAANLDAEAIADVTAPFLFGRTFHAEHSGLVDNVLRGTRPDAALRAFMVAQARALQHFDGVPLARRVRCPTLCIAGLEDTLTGADEIRATAELIPGAQYFEFDRAGHSLLLENKAVYEAMAAFLAS